MGKLVFLWENTMSKQKRTRRRFTAEFKAETVKLVKQSDRTMADIAMELGISAKSIGMIVLGDRVEVRFDEGVADFCGMDLCN